MLLARYAFIPTDFHEYAVSNRGMGYDSRDVVNAEGVPDGNKYEDVRDDRQWIKWGLDRAITKHLEAEGIRLAEPDSHIVVYSIVGEFGYERANELWLETGNERKERSELTSSEARSLAYEHVAEQTCAELGRDTLTDIVETARQEHQPTPEGRELMYDLGALHDERGSRYWGETFFREKRVEVFESWRRVLGDDDFDAYVSDWDSFTAVERDTIRDHILLEIDPETVEDLKETHETGGSGLAGPLLDHVGEDRIHEIAAEVASVDVEEIDVHTEVFDPDLDPLKPSLVEEEWPDWELDVLPEYVRETRGPADQQNLEQMAETSEYDPSEPPTNPPTPTESPFSTETVRTLSPESIAAWLNVPLNDETEASAYRIQRLVPDEEAMLVVDTLQGRLRWVQLDENNPYHPTVADGQTQGNLILGGIRGGPSEDLRTEEPPPANDRWELIAHERVTDTTLTFYDGVEWVHEMVRDAVAQAPDDDSEWSVLSTLPMDDDVSHLEVRAAPGEADVDDLWREHRTGERVLEDLYDGLSGGDVPAQHIMLVRPADGSFVAILAFGPESAVVEEFHRRFREAID